MRAILCLAALLAAGSAVAQPAQPPPDYRGQAMGAELVACVSAKVGVVAELLAARARIAELEQAAAKPPPARAP